MRLLVAFTCTVVQALVYCVIAVVYSLIAILIAELIWNSKGSGVYWGLSFASYTVPKLVDQSFEKFKDAHAVMNETREVWKVYRRLARFGDLACKGWSCVQFCWGIFCQCFFSAGIDQNGFIFKGCSSTRILRKWITCAKNVGIKFAMRKDARMISPLLSSCPEED